VSGQVVCAADGCENTFSRRPGRQGRPQIYCSPPCRPSYNRPPVMIEVEQDENDDVEHGRDWTVRLRRGERVLVVREALGRFSATVFAAELSAIVTGTPLPVEHR
jgi:hypothetical protein